MPAFIAGAVAQEKLGPGQCNAEFPVHYFYAWLDQSFPKLYMRLPLPDLGKLKDYVPGMLAIENIEAGKFDAKIARLLSSDELHVAALQAWYLRDALNLVYD